MQQLLIQNRSGLLEANRFRKREAERVEKEDWEKLMEKEVVDKELLDNLVMDFLITECNKEAAEEFFKESSCSFNPGERIEQRDKIKRLVSEGTFSESIKLIKELIPDFENSHSNLLAKIFLVSLSTNCQKMDLKAVVKFCEEKFVSLVLRVTSL